MVTCERLCHTLAAGGWGSTLTTAKPRHALQVCEVRDPSLAQPHPSPRLRRNPAGPAGPSHVTDKRR